MHSSLNTPIGWRLKMNVEKYKAVTHHLGNETLIDLHASTHTSLTKLQDTKDPLFATSEEVVPEREQQIADHQRKLEILNAELLKRMEQEKDVSQMNAKELFLHIEAANKEFHRRMVGTNGSH